MRRVRLAALLAPVLIATPGCVLEKPKSVDPAREELKRAAEWVYSEWCGNAASSPSYQEAAALVKSAGADILPVLAELVADPYTSDHLVGGALSTASDYPLSVEFRAAVRTRRDRYGASQSLLRYFVKFGDETDLAWMEKAVGELPEEDRKLGAERVRELRARLATN